MKTVELVFESEKNYFVREAFNTLRTNVLFSEKNIKSILVTSTLAHEGKTTISLELATKLAEGGKKVLLVDADLRKSTMVTTYTKERGLMGLSQLLSGQAEEEDSIFHTQIPGLDIVFAGVCPPNPLELLGSDAFKDLIKEKREIYDYIVVDSAPLGLVVDAAVIGAVCDGALIVLDVGRVRYRLAQEVKAQLEKSGCKLLGAVLNQTDRRAVASVAQRKSYSAYYYARHREMVEKNIMGSKKEKEPKKDKKAKKEKK